MKFITTMHFALFLLIAWFVTMPQDAVNAHILYDNKCKLMVVGVFIPTTMAAASKIYKQECIEFYRIQAEMQGKSITLDECEELYEKNYLHKLFLKAYQGYLQKVFIGSKEFKKNKAEFCRLVKGLYVAFLVAGFTDFILKEKGSVQDLTEQEINDLLRKKILTKEEKQKIIEYEQSQILKFMFSVLKKGIFIGGSVFGGIKLFL